MEVEREVASVGARVDRGKGQAVAIGALPAVHGGGARQGSEEGSGGGIKGGREWESELRELGGLGIST
jgi:hypothetical protein